ncbi:MAG: hypothetical protein ACPIAA_06085 [Flavobacteriaceae bacterium]
MRRLKRLLYYEFWPFWLLYFPAYFNWLRWAILAKHPTYFTAVNPVMNNSGAINTSKWAYLSKLPTHWIPNTIPVASKISPIFLKEKLQGAGLTFPLIAKPDRGERGKGVVLVKSFNELVTYIQTQRCPKLLLQDYCTLPNEAGLLYYRFPDQKKGQISSITTKIFCCITGDGRSTWGELIAQNMRIAHRLKVFKKTHRYLWNEPSISGQVKLIEPIGSHNLGTQFLNGQHLHSNKLEAQLDHWANQLPGFYYGRFDIKFDHWEDLLRGEKFKILEINGVNSEPTHIYDPQQSLGQAYLDIFFQMKIIYEISQKNRQLGIKPKRLLPFLYDLLKT